MKRISFSLLAIFCFFQVSAQDFIYEPLQSSGKLPQMMFTSTTDKYKSDIKNGEVNDVELSISNKKQFYLETNFRIDALLQSGKVVFNDPIGIYINQIVDEILKNDPQLRKQLQFLVVKSPFPNAFTTNDGIILINVGLINRLDTEAQLAYILCHEIAHYQAKHIVKGYALAVSLENTQANREKLSDFEKLILKNNYSRENEMMADSMGFELFTKTAYSTETLPPIFDMLRSAHKPYQFPQDPFVYVKNPYWEPVLPDVTKDLVVKSAKSKGNFVTGFEENASETGAEKVRIDSLEIELLTIDLPDIEQSAPENKLPDQLSPPQKQDVVTEEKGEEEEKEENEEDEDDSSTHPSTEKRKIRLLNQLIALAHDGEAHFIVSQDQFKRAQKLAAYELCRMFLLNAAYFDALYQAITLLEEAPEDPYLNEVVMKALYGIAKYRKEGSSLISYVDYDDRPARLDRFHQCFNKREYNKAEYLMIALAQAKYYLDRFPEEKHTLKYIKDLMFDLFEFIPDFEQFNDSADAKYLKFEKPLQHMLEDSVIKTCYEQVQEEKERSDSFDQFKQTNKGANALAKYRREKRVYGYRLGLDKVVVFSPFFYQLKSGKHAKMRFLKSEKEQKNMSKYIDQAAKKLKLSVVQMDSKNLSSEIQADRFNDIMLTNEWYADFIQHDDFLMVPMVYDEIQELCQKYGTSNFINIGSIAVTSDQLTMLKSGASTLLITIGYGAPWAVYVALRRNAHSLSYAITIDATTNEVLAYQYQEMAAMNKGTRLNALTYYYLWQLKARKK